MIHAMAACPSCGGEGVTPDAPCSRCGARSLPELALGTRAATVSKAPRRKEAQEEVALELAVDPRDLVQQRSAESLAPRIPSVPAGLALRSGESARPGRLSRPSGAPIAVGDLAFDARLLAEYGSPPAHWLIAPFYAWHVLRRQRALRRALVGRREEAIRTANEAEDALVTFAERARPTAEKQAPYAAALDELRRAEELLRSRDRVLAAEQDAQNARLAQVDARLSTLEEELAQAQANERTAAGTLAGTQAALAREEAKLKRAEMELRAAHERESASETGG
jgi:hypothetical protein